MNLFDLNFKINWGKQGLKYTWFSLKVPVKLFSRQWKSTKLGEIWVCPK